MKQLSFDEIMEHSAENRAIYDELLALMKESKGSGDYKVVPFVGAGMSAFAYPMWKASLIKLAKSLGNPPDFQEFMNQSDLEGAAEYLWEFGKHRIGEILRDEIFPPKKLDNLNIRTEPINVLLGLFPSSLIITTNFDQTIEKVFRTDAKSLQTLFPRPNSDVISKLPDKNNESHLFKIHGDIYQNEDNIVFPKSIYDQEYAEDSDLVNGLGKLFEARSMFILGASLDKDRTLDLLEKIRKNGPSKSHFALLDFDEDEKLQSERRKELEAYGIRPIFFPKGRYDSISVILEQLFSEVDEEEYRYFSPKLYRRFNIRNRFDWRQPLTDFLGRDEEFQKLIDFVENKGSKSSNPQLSWWAVCGPGGMGKNRLVNQLSYRRPEGWKYIELSGLENISRDSINNLIANRGSKIILIVDYAQSAVTEIARWLRSKKDQADGSDIRLIFLQREPYQYSIYESDGERQTSQAEIKPYWLKNLEIGWNDVESLSYQKKSLDLKPLNGEAIKDIILSYADFLPESKPEKKKPLTDKDADALLEALKKLGNDFLRPLFAMFFADAHLSGNEPLGWDEERILEHFSKREVMRLKDGLKTLYDKKGKDISNEDHEALDLIIALATIQGDLQIDPTKPLIDVFDCFKNELYPNRDFISLFKGMTDEGLLEFDDSKGHYIFRAIRPDLLGEWTVFNFFVNNNNSLSKFMNALKQSSKIETIEDFFVRFGGHYLSGHSIEKIKKAWLMELKGFLPVRNGMIIGLGTYAESKRDFSVFKTIKFFSEGFDDLYTVMNYSIYLGVQLTDQGANGIEAERQLMQLIKRSLFADKIALPYAHGLVNLTVHQESPKEIKGTIQKIETLLKDERFLNSEKINLAYTKSLFNLIISQENVKEREETVKKIEALLEDDHFPHSEEIALHYAQALVILTISQESLKEIKGTVQKIKLLVTKRFSNSEEIAIEYAKGLFNLTLSLESATEINKTVQKLEALLEDRFPKSEEVAIEYAKGLVNLSFKQESPNEISETAQKIQALLAVDRFPESEEIALKYAIALANLTANQESPKERERIVKMIKTLLEERFPDSEEIAFAYARALFNLTINQASINEIEGTVQNIEVLLAANRFPESEGIALAYARGLFNLSVTQSSAIELWKTVQRIEALLAANRFPRSEEIAIAYAKGLFNLSVTQSSPIEIEDTVQNIEALLGGDRFPKSEEIAIAYARGLFNLTVSQPSANEVEKTIQRIESLLAADRFPKSKEITLQYAKGLVNLTAKQESAKEREETVQEIKALLKYNRFPKSEDIAICYANGLVNLTDKQENAKEIKETVLKIEVLLKYNGFPKSKDIAISYAGGMVNLMLKSEDYNLLEEAYEKILNLIQYPPTTEMEVRILSLAFYHLLRVEKDLAKRRKLIDAFHELRLRFPDSIDLNELNEVFPLE